MKNAFAFVVLSTIVVVTTATAHAGQGAQTAKPASPAPQAAKPAPAPAPEAPFPAGAVFAYVDLNRVTAESTDGKAARSKMGALQEAKKVELQKQQEALQAAQQKLTNASLGSSDSARAQLQKEAERLERDLQRAAQDAEEELRNANRDLDIQFQRKLYPVLSGIAKEKGLHKVFSLRDAALLWWDPSLDLSTEVIKRLDAAPAVAAAPGKP